MKRKIISFLLGICALQLSAQTSEETPFTPSGKPVIAIFSDFHVGADGEKGFDMERCYIGYQYRFTPSLSTKVVYDMGNPKISGSGIERLGYVKNAMLTWQTGKFMANVGLIGLEEFSVQEKFWGLRYVRKSFQDEYKYGNSADMGVVVKYAFSENFSIDATVINGEGYKKVRADNSLRYGLGVTSTAVKGLTLRAYADRYDKPETDTLGVAQNNLALFAGYKAELFSLGLEYNALQNAKFVEGKNLYGVSVYSTVKMNTKWNIFARWDFAQNGGDSEEQNAVVGLQYTPVKNVKIAPNVRYSAIPGEDDTLFGYLNLSVTL